MVFGIEVHRIHRKGLQEYLGKKSDASVGLVEPQTCNWYIFGIWYLSQKGDVCVGLIDLQNEIWYSVFAEFTEFREFTERVCMNI